MWISIYPLSYAGSWTGKMSSERPNLQHRRRLNESLLIHGPSHVLANSGQDLKSPRAQTAYELVYLCSIEGFSYLLESQVFVLWKYTGNRIIQTYIITLYASSSPIEYCNAAHTGSLERERCISVLLIAVV